MSFAMSDKLFYKQLDHTPTPSVRALLISNTSKNGWQKYYLLVYSCLILSFYGKHLMAYLYFT